MKKIFAYLVVVSILSLLSGCSKQTITQPEKEVQKSGALLFKIDKTNAPKEVVEIEAILSREDYDTLKAAMNLLTDSTADLAINGIDAGTWHLRIDAKNSEQKIIYSGETDVEVQEGITVQVSLTLLPTGIGTGNIYIMVNWGKSNILTLQPDGKDGKDALISALHGDTNYGENYSDFIIFSGYGDDYDCTKRYRNLLEFDLSSLTPNTKIKSAYLSLFYNSTTGFGWGGQGHAGENSFYIERIISNWDENTVTWDNQPPTTTENRVIVPKSTDLYQDYSNIDVTKLVQDIVSNPDSSFGFMFKLVAEEPTAQVILYSSDCADPLKRPKLVVHY